MKPPNGISELVPVSGAVPRLRVPLCLCDGSDGSAPDQQAWWCLSSPQPRKMSIQLEEWLRVLMWSWLWEGKRVLRLHSSGIGAYDSQELSLAVLTAPSLPSEDTQVELPTGKEQLLSIIITSAAIIRKHPYFLPSQGVISSSAQPQNFWRRTWTTRKVTGTLRRWQAFTYPFSWWQ